MIYIRNSLRDVENQPRHTVPESHRETFGKHLRYLRRSRVTYSQEEFARYVGLDRTYISGLERGKRNPTLETIVILARGLDVHPSDLLKTLPKESLGRVRPPKAGRGSSSPATDGRS